MLIHVCKEGGFEHAAVRSALCRSRLYCHIYSLVAGMANCEVCDWDVIHVTLVPLLEKHAQAKQPKTHGLSVLRGGY
jgi:hypothetical protein